MEHVASEVSTARAEAARFPDESTESSAEADRRSVPANLVEIIIVTSMHQAEEARLIPINDRPKWKGKATQPNNLDGPDRFAENNFGDRFPALPNLLEWAALMNAIFRPPTMSFKNMGARPQVPNPPFAKSMNREGLCRSSSLRSGRCLFKSTHSSRPDPAQLVRSSSFVEGKCMLEWHSSTAGEIEKTLRHGLTEPRNERILAFVR